MSLNVSWCRLIASVALVALVAPVRADAEGMSLGANSRRKLIEYVDTIPGVTNRVPMDTKGAIEIHSIIRLAAFRGGLNIVTSSSVGGNVQLALQDVPIGQLLEFAMAAVSPPLAFEVEGNVIKIMTAAEYQQRHGVNFYDQRILKTITLRAADPVHINTLLENVKSPQGALVADAKTRTVLLYDTPDKIREMEIIIARADHPGVNFHTRTYTLQYADVTDVERLITPEIPTDLGRIRTDERTKKVIIETVSNRFEKIEMLIAQIDVPSRQVFIEAKVVEVTLDEAHSLGVNWRHLFDGVDPRFHLETIVKPGLAGISAAGGQLSYNTIIAGGELSLVLQALQNIGETKSLSNPQIMVSDGYEATIKVIEDQPYKERQFESGTTNIVSEIIKFVEVGVLLNVTPTINDRGFISMDISPEISSITQWFDGEPQQGTPVVRKALAQTSVSIKDGTTIIIAGLIRTSDQETVTAIPLLGHIPVLGHLFKYTTRTALNTETVIFLTPRIVGGDLPFARMRDTRKRSKPMRVVGKEPPRARERRGIR